MFIAPVVRMQVNQKTINAENCKAIERIVWQLHVPLDPNPIVKVSSIDIKEMVYTFWDEFTAFQKSAEPFDKSAHWKCADAGQGKSNL